MKDLDPRFEITGWWHTPTTHVYFSPVGEGLWEIASRAWQDPATNSASKKSWGVPVENAYVESYFTVCHPSQSDSEHEPAKVNVGVPPQNQRSPCSSTIRRLARVRCFCWPGTRSADSLEQQGCSCRRFVACFIWRVWVRGGVRYRRRLDPSPSPCVLEERHQQSTSSVRCYSATVLFTHVRAPRRRSR